MRSAALAFAGEPLPAAFDLAIDRFAGQIQLVNSQIQAEGNQGTFRYDADLTLDGYQLALQIVF